MKKLYLIISIVVCLLSFILKVEVFGEEEKIIVIDPGHGGMDIGASIDNVYESDLTLEISFKIKKVLEENGYTVILTRYDKGSLSGDVFIKKKDMNKRIEIINKSNALLAISIHLNKFSIAKYSGAQTFYSNSLSENEMLAESIQKSFVNNLKNTNRSKVLRNNIYLLNKVSIPCCIAECGFMSNPEEFTLLKEEEYQYKIALAILKGINNYLYEKEKG